MEKKAVSRKAPVVKQTLTSMYRMAKANPLMLVQDENTDDYGLSNIKLPESVLRPTMYNICDIDKPNKELSTKKPANIKPTGTRNLQKPPGHLSRTSSLRINRTKTPASNVALQRTASVKIQLRGRNQPVPSTSHPQTKPPTAQAKTKIVNKPQQRRSLSAEHYDRKRQLFQTQAERVVEKKETTRSLNDIPKKVAFNVPLISPIAEEQRGVTFRTPSAYKRRSMSVSTPTPYRKYSPMSTSFASTPTPQHDGLRNRLEKWLQKHKKPIHSYHHLKCFDLHIDQDNKYDEENKENIEEAGGADSLSYEDLRISPQPMICDTPQPSSSSSDLRVVAQAALNDLHKLIIDGYSREHCEAWLGRIREKYQYLDEEPEYWECRAAIEQSRGNLTSAVECLRTAIVHGAEVKAVDNSLEQLLEKFSLLNISTSSMPDEDRHKRDRARIVTDARNVFKSSIIQFAVQERTLKKNKLEVTQSEKKYIVTPVRRSTRSRSGYTLTPGVRVCGSLKDLSANEQQSFDFRGNNALCVNFCNN